MKFPNSLLLFVLALLTTSGFAQQESFEGDLQHNSVRVFDANGKPFVNPNIDVEGSAFFIPEWKYGLITAIDNKVYSKRLLRLNFQSQEVHYLSENNQEMTLPAGMVKEITIFDSSIIPAAKYHFQSGFPPVDNLHNFTFYQIICEGKIKLLKSIRKLVVEDKNELAAHTTKEIKTYEDYYIFTGTSLIRVKRNNDLFLPLLKDKKAEIDQYLKKTNLGTRNASDIKLILDYYNSL